MPKKQEYSEAFKLQVLDHYKTSDNISETCRHFDITRQTFYNWQKDEERIRSIGAKQDVLPVLVERGILTAEELKQIESYPKLLEHIGTTEERKKKLGAKVEVMMHDMLNILEKHPDLDKISPKDLSKVITDMEGIRQKLYNEPDVVVEMRSQWRVDAISAMQRVGVTTEQIREFSKVMQAMEAEYEIV